MEAHRRTTICTPKVQCSCCCNLTLTPPDPPSMRGSALSSAKPRSEGKDPPTMYSINAVLCSRLIFQLCSGRLVGQHLLAADCPATSRATVWTQPFEILGFFAGLQFSSFSFNQTLTRSRSHARERLQKCFKQLRGADSFSTLREPAMHDNRASPGPLLLNSGFLKAFSLLLHLYEVLRV